MSNLVIHQLPRTESKRVDCPECDKEWISGGVALRDGIMRLLTSLRATIASSKLHRLRVELELRNIDHPCRRNERPPRQRFL